MKKFVSAVLSAAMAASLIALPVSSDAAENSQTETISYSYSAGDMNTYSRQMEKLDRGLTAVKTSGGVYLSWRLLDSEDARFGSAEKNVSFNVYRDDQKIAEVSDTTNYTDTTAGANYSVAPVADGVEGKKCEAVSVWDNSYIDIPLTKPDQETIYDPNGTKLYDASFSPADCSAGDLDGDGEYEIVVKWTSSERDVGSPGDPAYSGTVHLAAYKLDGTKLWNNDIELGKNVYSSAHTVQFLVYDFDSDGKAEVMCQTSLGSKDAEGAYVSQSAKADSVVVSSNKKIAEFTDDENASADYRGDGRIITGEEFLTVFSGETGAAIDTIDLPTTRGSAKGVDYGDDFGNRSNRFVASVAYLDGEKPYAVYLRGYYFGRNGKQRTSIAGISFDGERLSPDYRFDTQKNQPGYYEGAYNYVGNGNHNCTVADVDNDGKDEFITGALCMEVNDENQFRPLWCTHKEHGDALHIGDYDPTHTGLEFFTVHEDGDAENTTGGYGYTNSQGMWCDFGMSVIDAATGEIMFHVPNTKDTGRGVMANTGSGGYYQITGVGSYQCNGGSNFTPTKNGAGSNFRIFWDGDLYDNLLDGTRVTDWNGSNMSEIFDAGSFDCLQINGTKSNPALQADLFGDWREELVYPTTDGNNLRIFMTTTPTDYKIKTLMHDPVYRSGVAAEQTAYNQPPHVGMYLSEDLFGEEATNLEVLSTPAKTTYVIGEKLDTTGLTVKATYDDGTSKNINSYFVSGYDPNTAGAQAVKLSYMNTQASFNIEVKDIESIEIVSPPAKTVYTPSESFDPSGLVVRATYEGNITRDITDYTISEYNSNLLGAQTITVSYLGKTAEFDITVKRVESIVIVSPPKNINVYTGGSINTAGLVVRAVYTDGSSDIVDDYTISCKTSTLGEAVATVKYMNKTATFKINVLPPSIDSINNTYATNSTESVLTTVPIGSYMNDFTIEHTVTINSMPANGDADKNSTAGFFTRFMATVQNDVSKLHTGGGWYLTANGSKANVYWKSGASRNNSTAIASGSKALSLGSEYTFRYEFTNVGTGSGALLKLSIIDSDGNTVASVSNLNVRNFSDTDLGKTSPITQMEIYNQAQSGSASNIVFGNARVYSSGNITKVDGKEITVNLASSAGMKVYAAKYSGGALDAVNVFTPENAGESVFTADFEPDRVFLWSNDIMPIDMWSNGTK